MAAGMLLDMSIYAYLLFGIPLPAGFQLFVRKRPIKDLWVRGDPGLSPRTVSLRLAIPLAIVPCVHLAVSVVKGQGLGYIGYALAAIVGAGAAAYALGRFRRETWRYLGLCVATASLLGVLLTIGAAWHDASMVHPTGGRPHPNALFGIESLPLYIPALFMMEEVAFRAQSTRTYAIRASGMASRRRSMASHQRSSCRFSGASGTTQSCPVQPSSSCSSYRSRWDPSSPSSGAGRGTSWCPGSRMPYSTRYETPSAPSRREEASEAARDKAYDARQ